MQYNLIKIVHELETIANDYCGALLLSNSNFYKFNFSETTFKFFNEYSEKSKKDWNLCYYKPSILNIDTMPNINDVIVAYEKIEHFITNASNFQLQCAIDLVNERYSQNGNLGYWFKRMLNASLWNTNVTK